MAYQDQTLVCRDCGKSFIFSARDQEFFAKKGFTNLPTRCKDCRDKRKKTVEEAANRPIFTIQCKKCGKTGEMSIEPNKPNDVLCSDCFYEEFKKQIDAKKVAPHEETTEESESENSPAEETA